MGIGKVIISLFFNSVWNEPHILYERIAIDTRSAVLLYAIRTFLYPLLVLPSNSFLCILIFLQFLPHIHFHILYFPLSLSIKWHVSARYDRLFLIIDLYIQCSASQNGCAPE